MALKKVLVIPARFQDEGFNYNGSSAPLVDQFGNVLYPEMQKESFEPVTPENLHAAMQLVKEFYLRNSDDTFHLEPVIAPTVTMSLNKYQMERGGGNPNLYDTNGSFVSHEPNENIEGEELKGKKDDWVPLLLVYLPYYFSKCKRKASASNSRRC